MKVTIPRVMMGLGLLVGTGGIVLAFIKIPEGWQAKIGLVGACCSLSGVFFTIATLMAARSARDAAISARNLSVRTNLLETLNNSVSLLDKVSTLLNLSIPTKTTIDQIGGLAGCSVERCVADLSEVIHADRNLNEDTTKLLEGIKTKCEEVAENLQSSNSSLDFCDVSSRLREARKGLDEIRRKLRHEKKGKD